MKISFRVLFILLAISFSGVARANHHLVFVHQLVKLSSSSCAVELDIDANGQNAFQAVDRIVIDGTLLASLESTAATIDNGGHTNQGDSILFASNSFMTQTGISADHSFSDSECSLFAANATFAYVLDDPDFGGPDHIVDSLQTGSNFGGDNTAMVKSSESAVAQLVDLTVSSVQIADNGGTIVTVGHTVNSGGGTSGNNINSGGGCSLEGEAFAPSSGSGYVCMLSGLTLVLGSLKRSILSSNAENSIL